MVNTSTKTGYISQIIGPVVDIEFPSGNLPKIYNSLIITAEGIKIVCEVQQLLGNNKVRAVSMTSTRNLTRSVPRIATYHYGLHNCRRQRAIIPNSTH